ncbi:variant-surface-glyco phospholipase C [Fusarium heterosporum]|uniref:Variant-surface-glyco phospholipase C n=1 Tax=Fusarium heterosporum TaxID=42747 RepID=A0A8H5SZQ5_FUSHE|nr:variant-surface-glyco phospholipase C [Fusarium heterosporum]
MGEGGRVTVINGTPYRWRRTGQNNYQMNDWNFPEVIEPGSVSGTYVEFDHGIFTTRSDTNGYVVYDLEGTNHSFTVKVRDSPSNISVELGSVAAVNNPKGSTINLGWRHDGNVSFVLSGKEGSFHTLNPPIDWMQQSLSTMGKRSLSQICMLGTHNAGMSFVSHSDFPNGLVDDYVLCQSTPVLGQLTLGSRYLDVRPLISAGEFWTGHYASKIGGRGESLASIIAGINQFLSHTPELVIVNISHTLQTDTGAVWREFDLGEWHRLLRELLKLDHLFVVRDQKKAQDLSLVTLDEYIGNGRGAVICVIENESLDLGDEFRDKGFYKPSQLNVRNEYSNKDDAVVMVHDQLTKMKGHMSTGDKRLFLLSWTLTQQVPDWDGDIIGLITKVLSFLKPIRTLAYTCNKELVTYLLPEVSNSSFPNVVYIDYLDSSEYVALVMAVNDKIFNN